MHSTSNESRISRWITAWNGFWFTPGDPTVLAAIRILTGAITLYTLFAYTFDLDALIGENAWLDLPLRQLQYRTDLVPNVPFDWMNPGVPFSTLTTGHPIWSIWFHVTDPSAMMLVHGLILLSVLLFTIGFATRVTSVLTWFGALSYIHRAPGSVFGVDTMMTVLLLYLMIGPSGAALSVDRLIERWRAKRAGLPVPPVTPSVSANFALRLIQIHSCIIYGMAGLSKLQGASWWFGTAPWGTIANFEYAPMHMPGYIEMLRFMARTRWLYEVSMTVGAMGTLVFEIGYPFAIWRPSLRPAWLWMAVLMHLGIGMFLGLRTFSLMMLGFNLAFVSAGTVRRFIPGKSKNDEPPAKVTVSEGHPQPTTITTKQDKGAKVVVAGQGKRKH